MIRNAAVLKLSDQQLINSEPHCYFFKFLWKSVMTCWQYTVWLWSHKRLYFESFEKKEEKLDSLCSTHPDKYLSYHQITFCGSFSGSTDFGGFLCEMIKKAHFFKRKQVSNKIAGNCVSPPQSPCFYYHWEMWLTLISVSLFFSDCTCQITICLDTVNY